MLRQTLSALALLGVVACDDDPAGPGDDSRTYEITLTNLTTGQLISPGVFVIHDNTVSVFAVGATASAGVQMIAESGDPAAARTALTGATGVEDVDVSTAPAHRIGGTGSQSVTVTLTSDDPDATLLSVAAMLGCTNDGFVGARNVTLPTGSTDVTVDLVSYDAGTEVNTGVGSDIPPGCWMFGPVTDVTGGTGHTAENGTIANHAGITPIGDLTAAHAWTNPAARIVISRVD